MKKLLFGCALAVSGLFMPAADANFYGPGCGPCDPCCDVGNFNGFYFGGNVGAITNLFHRNDFDGFLTTDDFDSLSTQHTDVTAGVQLGYDWQCNSRLFGLVVDWNWVNTDRTSNIGTTARIRNRDQWFTTIRGRFGLTVCDALAYVTLGAVVSRFDTRWESGATFFRDRHSRWGWTGGVGTEFLLGCNWSLGAEVLYLGFCDRTRRTTIAGVTSRLGHSDSAFVGRILLNYRFGDLCSCW